MLKLSKCSYQEIIVLLQEKKIEGISILYDKYASAVYGAICRDISNLQLAEGILGETFMVIWKNSSLEYRYRNRLLLYLLTVSKKLTIKSEMSAAQKAYSVTVTDEVNIF